MNSERNYIYAFGFNAGKVQQLLIKLTVNIKRF